MSAREGIEFLRRLVGLDIIAVDVNTVSPPLEPEDPVRLDGMGELDAIGQIIGGVHVQHQKSLVANRSTHSTDPLGFRSNGADAGLELYPRYPSSMNCASSRP